MSANSPVMRADGKGYLRDGNGKIITEAELDTDPSEIPHKFTDAEIKETADFLLQRLEKYMEKQ